MTGKFTGRDAFVRQELEYAAGPVGIRAPQENEE
jgi:hypothetical protein